MYTAAVAGQHWHHSAHSSAPWTGRAAYLPSHRLWLLQRCASYVIRMPDLAVFLIAVYSWS